MDRRIKCLFLSIAIAAVLLLPGCDRGPTLDATPGIDLGQYHKVEVIDFHVLNTGYLENQLGSDQSPLVITTMDQAEEAQIPIKYPQITEEYFEDNALVIADMNIDKGHWFAEFYGLYEMDGKICPVVRQVERGAIQMEAAPEKYSIIVRVAKGNLTKEVGEAVVLEKTPQEFGLVTIQDEPYETVEMYNSRPLVELGSKQEDLGITIVNSLSELQDLDLGLEYNQDFFKEKSLVICSVQCCTGKAALEISGLVADDGKLCPVVRMYESTSQSDNSFYEYLVAEVSKEVSNLPAGEILYIGACYSNCIWDLDDPIPRPEWTYGLP